MIIKCHLALQSKRENQDFFLADAEAPVNKEKLSNKLGCQRDRTEGGNVRDRTSYHVLFVVRVRRTLSLAQQDYISVAAT